MEQERFAPQGLGEDVFNDRYTRFEEESWEEASRRVADHVAQAEDNGKIQKFADRFNDQIASGLFMPGGRIWYGAGRPKAQLLNCYVVPTEDSIEGWAKSVGDVMIISSKQGGVGLNFSPIRPRGTPKSSGGYATGAVSLMEVVNAPGEVLVSGGGRRMALMFCLNLSHPDLPEFLDVKLDRGKLNNANISVVIDMPAEEFQRKVRENENIDFEFNGVKVGTSMSAQEIWKKIVYNAWESGEPGVLNGHLANSQNNIHYYKSLVSTNPCGEIWLEPYGCCDLGALVLNRFVDTNGEVSWDALDESIRLGVRFLDNVLTVNNYPLQAIKDNCEDVRRIGLGVMGLHTMLMKMGMKYDSPEAQAFCDEKLAPFIKNTAYDSSINLAIEKGPFPAYDQRLLDSGFAKTLKRGIRNKIKEYGIRNCAILTIAPTGTTSIVQGVSSGIEPLPAVVYWRTRFVNTTTGERERTTDLVVESAFYEFPDVVQSAADIDVKNHFEMQKIWQKHIDNAVSKTINLPKDYPVDELADLWLEYLPHMKGSTFYRWGSREYEPISPIPREEWEAVLASQNGNGHGEITEEEFLSIDCATGVCEISDRLIEKVAS
jgi:ribonucleoside-diphosphate reductase alpha chain